MKMRELIFLATMAVALLAWVAPADATGKVYRWVDEHGVVHFGDAIPPEYSRQRHEVLDRRGTRQTVHGEEIDVARPRQSNRDRALLATYGSVTEIESVRDRRTGYLDSQNEVALERLRGLQLRQQELEGNPVAINELGTVEQRIREYDAEIDRRNAEINRIRAQFDEDIARFIELRGTDEAENGEESTASATDR